MVEKSRSIARRAGIKVSSSKKPAVQKKPTAKRAGASTPAKRSATSAAAGASKARPTPPRSEVRALKEALAKAEAELERAKSAHDRAAGRITSRAEREREALEAQLTKLVQEIGQLRQYAERVQRLEAECRQKDSLLAERAHEWDQQRAALQAQIVDLRARHERRSAAGTEGEAEANQPELFPQAGKS